MKYRKELELQKQDERKRAKAMLATLAGKTIDDLSPKEQKDLLIVLSLVLGVADASGKIKA